MAKLITLWVTYHHGPHEGWDLKNVYRLQRNNKTTLKNQYPLIEISDLLDQLHYSKCLTKLDFKSRYL
jgi:hypothetical protein